MDAFLTTSDLSRRYRTNLALDHLDLTLPHGISAVLGHNGAGKSTLVRILTTLERADGGTAIVRGLDVRRDAAALRASIGVTGQHASIDLSLTARESLRLIGRLLGLSRPAARARADVLIERFGLGAHAHRVAAGYSGGLLRRLDLAASLVVQPQALFLDEPTTGLDPISRDALWDDIRSFAATGTDVLLTTQYLEEADALAEHVAILRAGTLVAEGSPAALTSAHGTTILELVDAAGTVIAQHPSTGTAADLQRTLAALESTHQSLAVRVRTPTLDDVFRALAVESTAPDTTEVNA